MAHFAKLGIGNIITTVEVVSNDIATTEQAGVDFLIISVLAISFIVSTFIILLI